MTLYDLHLSLVLYYKHTPGAALTMQSNSVDCFDYVRIFLPTACLSPHLTYSMQIPTQPRLLLH